jgi:hypothetical protein
MMSKLRIPKGMSTRVSFGSHWGRYRERAPVAKEPGRSLGCPNDKYQDGLGKGMEDYYTYYYGVGYNRCLVPCRIRTFS